MSLQLAFNIDDKATTIQLKGSLNEYSSALDGVVVNPNLDLNVDLKELKAINSLGVRNFHSWIKTVQCQKLRFHHCPRIFINQMNLFEGFLPEKSEIESFFAPYYSETTGEDLMVLFTKNLEYSKVDGKMVLKIPEVKDSQGAKMDLDTFADQYFKFLKNYF